MEKKCSTCRYENGNWCERSGGSCTGYEHWKPKDGENEAPQEKTLLDEFAIAAMIRWMIGSGDAKTIDSGGAFDWAKQAGECYNFAAAMMKERARRNDDGTLKEEVTEQ